MKNYLRVLLATAALLANSAQSFANFAMSPSGATTAFAIDAANQGTALCAAASTECGATVLINTAGAPLGVAATPMQVSLANTGANATAVKVDGSAVTQPVSLASTTITGTVALVANQSTNEAQINGVTPLMGNGVTGTGSQRVTIASDNTAFAVNSTLSAETTKVIGTARLQGNVGGVLDAIGQNVAAPANWLQTGCQFQTTPTTITATNGSPCQMDNAGNLLVNVKTATGTAEGSTASGTTFSILGADAVTSEKTAVTSGQNGRLVTDLVGKLIVLPYANPENFVSGLTAAMTGTTDTAITGMGAPGAGLRNYLTTLVCGNSHATVGTFVDIKDGSGGAVLFTIPAAAVYGGAAFPLPVPLRQPTTNTGLFAHDQTTGANVICSGVGYKGA